VFAIQSPQRTVCSHIFWCLDLLPLWCHQCPPAPDCQTGTTPLPSSQGTRRAGNTTDSCSSRYWPGNYLRHGEITTQSSDDLVYAGGWGLQGQRNTTSRQIWTNIGRHLSKMNADLKELLSFLFPGYSAIQSTVYKHIVSIPMNRQLYISGTILLYSMLHVYFASGCWSFFENGNRCSSPGGVVLYDPSYSDSYLVCAISNRDDHELKLDFAPVRYVISSSSSESSWQEQVDPPFPSDSLVKSPLGRYRRENGRTSGRDSTNLQRRGNGCAESTEMPEGTYVSGRMSVRRRALRRRRASEFRL
jgi:hypothetical protein